MKWIFSLFEKFGPLRFLDGYKTYIGFSLLAFGILLQVLLFLFATCADTFPAFAFCVTGKTALTSAVAAFGKLFEQLGLYIAGFGLWHDKYKRIQIEEK